MKSLRLLAVLTLLFSGASMAQLVILDPSHTAQVNRQRRIFHQYDPAVDILLKGGFGADIGKVMDYAFAYADQPGSQLDAICLDISNEGVAHYRSKLLPPIQHPGLVKWRAEGIDYFERWISEGHKRKKEMWWGLRMNEVERGHSNGVDGASVTLREQNPVKAAHPAWLLRSWWWQGFWNYSVKELRDFRLQMIEEVISQYDFDGIHLDFLRHTPHLAPGAPWQQRQHMTDFIASVRAMLQKKALDRGRPILLAARVPDSLQGAHTDGLDIETWAQLRLVDVLILGTRSIDVNVDSFKQAIGGANIKLIPSFDSYHATDGYQGQQPMELLRGVFGNYWFQGADGVGIFNQSGGPPDHARLLGIAPLRASIAEMMSSIGSLSTLSGRPRFYALDRRGGYLYGEGHFSSNRNAQLPAVLRNDQTPVNLTLPIWESFQPSAHALLSLVFDPGERKDLGAQLPASPPSGMQNEFHASWNAAPLELQSVDPAWKDDRLFSPAPQPETMTYDAINKHTENQRLVRVVFRVPTSWIRRGPNKISVSVTRKGAFPPRKFVSLEKLELHVP